MVHFQGSNSDSAESDACCRVFRASVASARDPNLAKLAAARRTAEEEDRRAAEREAKTKKELERNKNDLTAWKVHLFLKTCSPPHSSLPSLPTCASDLATYIPSLRVNTLIFVHSAVSRPPSHSLSSESPSPSRCCVNSVFGHPQ